MLRVTARTNGSFGALLRRFRIAAGLSQEALAEQARIDPESLNAIERDDATPPAGAVVEALAAALALSPERRGKFDAAAAAAGMPPAAPAAADSAGKLTNVPDGLPSFVGRDAELGELAAALSTSRLVTIAGAGGVGKSRLAQQAALDGLAGYRDGAWVVELAPLADPELVPAALAAVLRIPDAGAKPLVESLVAALRKKRALLVFDNCEHLRASVAALAETLLAGCPKLHVIATSREALAARDEVLYKLQPLSVGDGTTAVTAGEALRFGAVALFVARAQAASAEFVLTDALAPAVVEICRRLDGIALAIELAAARLAVIGVEQLAQRLDDRFRLLSDGTPSTSHRHTLRALFDWSFDLLDASERAVFVRLAIFRGSFTAEAVEELCAPIGADVAAALASLVGKSLVVPEPGGERYRLAATTAEYAAEKLTRLGEYEAAARALAGWALRFAERLAAAWEKTPETEWRASVECELDNLRAALEWSLGRGRDWQTGAAIVAALGHYWRASKREGRRWVEAALAEAGDEAPRDLCARLTLGLSWTLPVGRQALDAAERAVRAYRELGDDRTLAMALLNLNGVLRAEPGWFERGEAVAEEALELARKTGFRRLIPMLLGALADRKRERGRLDEARELLESALALAREENNLLGLATALSRLAEVEFAAGDFAAARRYGAEATETDARRLVETAVSADRCDLAAYAIADGDLAAACEEAREVIAMADRVDQPVHVAIAVDHLAVVAALSGDCVRATKLFGFSNAVFTRLAYARQPVEQRGEQQARALVNAALSEDELARLAAEGEHWSRDEAIAEALRVVPAAV
jgi:predicted ATPase/DNA-binding XRE family transcriptional regulator